MQITSPTFKDNAHEALADAQLQKALGNVEHNFIDKRQMAADTLPEFEALRDSARDVKNHTLAHIDLYLETYEKKVMEAGGHVHWAETAEDARATILDICRKADARTVTKGKSIVTEEIGLNGFLEENGITPVETDLGEYIIQLRGEAPSHIIAPAVHVNQSQVEEDFRRVHTHLDPMRDLSEPTTLLNEARGVLRQKYFDADVGITGANFLIAETGTSVIVTNEGNGDLTQTLPKVHIVVATLEKVTPTLEDVPKSCACWRARRPARTCRSTRPSLRVRADKAIQTDRRNTMWLSSTTAAQKCWAPNIKICCAASAAAPA